MSHSPVLVTGLTANSVDLTRTDLRILARVTSGLYDGLEYRGIDVPIPTRVGRAPQPHVADVRTIVADEALLAGLGADEDAQRADLEATLLVLDALMREDQNPYVLEVTLMGGGTATINARPSGFDPVETKAPALMLARFEWVSLDPDWVFV